MLYLRGATEEEASQQYPDTVLINNSSARQGAVPPSFAWTDTSDGYGTRSQTSPNVVGARSRGRNGSTDGKETGDLLDTRETVARARKEEESRQAC